MGAGSSPLAEPSVPLEEQWFDLARCRVDFVVDDVSEWVAGERVRFQGVVVTASEDLADRLVAAASETAADVAAVAIAEAREPILPFDPALESCLSQELRDVVESEIELALSPDAIDFSDLPIVHSAQCNVPSRCQCPDGLVWVSRRARKRHPALESDILEQALKRIERWQTKSGDSSVTESYMQQLYGFSLADVRRSQKNNKERVDRLTDRALLTKIASRPYPARSDRLWLLLPQELGDENGDWLSLWSVQEAEHWLDGSAVGRFVQSAIQAQPLDWLSGWARREGRGALIAVAVTIVAHALALDQSDPPRDRQLSILADGLKGACGGAGTRNRAVRSAKRLGPLLGEAIELAEET